MDFIIEEHWKSLEFDKVLVALKAYTYGEKANQFFDSPYFFRQEEALRKALQLANECKIALDRGDFFSLPRQKDLQEIYHWLTIDGSVLTQEQLAAILQLLESIQSIQQYFTEERKISYPGLAEVIAEVPSPKQWLKDIHQIMDEEGQIRQNASPELARLYRKVGDKQKELARNFKSVIQQYKKKGWLTDSEESFRNGRRVLSVPAEHKRKVRGIIHDESATGKTAFIEPEHIIEINNDLFDLDIEIKREIFRILKAISAELRPHTTTFETYQAIIDEYDIINAKARLGRAMNATAPKIVSKDGFSLEKAFHPLLYLKNKEVDKPTIPFNLILEKNRLLILSGPNAGGKSITLKAVGLLQLMLQSGLLLPLEEHSEMSLFENILVDIGDQQSLEDDLSTYSSRLKNMRYFLEESNARSLILIDEFGSGTDPKIGGAIAEGLLREFVRRKVFGLITTHYSNLKIFAFRTKGIVNGAMTFDQELLTPTYHLKVGRPGSSYAFEIGRKSGLPEGILEYAQKRAGKDLQGVDTLLIELQREKKEVEDRLAALEAEKANADRLAKTYHQLHEDLKVRKKRLKLDQKQWELAKKDLDNKKLENLVRQLAEEKKIDKAKALAQQVRAEKKALREEVEQMADDIYVVKKTNVKDVPIEEGSFVRLRNSNSSGKVIAIQKNKAKVQVGSLFMTVPLRDLEPGKEPLEINSSKGVSLQIDKDAQGFSSKIDIRGMRKSDAGKLLDNFLDGALLNNMPMLEIIHGKGNGVLREVVREKLRQYPAASDIKHPEDNQGGEGVTLVFLK